MSEKEENDLTDWDNPIADLVDREGGYNDEST